MNLVKNDCSLFGAHWPWLQGENYRYLNPPLYTALLFLALRGL
jgi:hypothetical protein